MKRPHSTETAHTLAGETLRGVNLGGWLVLEKWMCPEVFDGSLAESELDLSLTEAGRVTIKKHHSTFIVEEDFKWLRDNGLNAVRIPVGYWIFGDHPPFVNGISHLDRAFRYAQTYNIKVLVCLHGAPGSQNGQDHGGTSAKRTRWFTNPAYRTQTLDVLARLVERYASHPAYWGIELLNEPQPGPLKFFVLRRFYREAQRRLAKHTRIIFSDAFLPRLMNGVLGPRAVMDVHWYHFNFLLERFRSMRLYAKLLRLHGRLLQRLRRTQPVIVGEWSIVLSTHTLRHFPEHTHESMMDKHGQDQLATYAVADGWFYWSYKTTGRGTWNFRSLVEDRRLILPWRSKTAHGKISDNTSTT